MGGADDHEAAVGADIVDAVGDGDGDGLGTEVVVVDGLGSLRPDATGVLEVADQFTLLGIDADAGQAALGELHALLGEVLELLVAVWTGACRDALVVDAQPVVKVP